MVVEAALLRMGQASAKAGEGSTKVLVVTAPYSLHSHTRHFTYIA